MGRDATYRGCASTLPSTVMVKSFPKVDAVTFDGVRIVSWRFWPERALSLCQVRTFTCAWQAARQARNIVARRMACCMIDARIGVFHSGLSLTVGARLGKG